MSVETIAAETRAQWRQTLSKTHSFAAAKTADPVTQTDNAKVNEDELSKSLEQIQVMMDLRNRAVEFTTDEVSGAQVVKVVTRTPAT